MRKIYLVKKDPELPADGNNWIVMSGHEFAMFMQTPEGKPVSYTHLDVYKRQE